MPKCTDRDAEDQFIADNGDEWSANVRVDRDGLSYYVSKRRSDARAPKAVPKAGALCAADRADAASVLRSLKNRRTVDLAAVRMPVLVAVASKLTGANAVFANKAAVIEAIQARQAA